MATFSIEASDTDSFARLGRLRTLHGHISTPAFVPLASRGAVKGLLPAEVASIGFQMVLGNTFHLMLSPGAELIEQLGGLHSFIGWEGPIITDSGGFQVFSMGHGTVADEIKSRAPHRARASSRGTVLAIEEQGVRFRSYIDGSQHRLTPERSMQVQASLRSDIALAFDECTPFHVSRDYTARSMERTHRWLARCIDWHEANAPKGQLLYGIVQGGVYQDLRRQSSALVASSGCDGVAIGGSLGGCKEQMHQVVGYALSELRTQAQLMPRHLLGIGEVDDLIACVQLGIDTFDCAMPTRLARHGTALVADPQSRWRMDLLRAARRADRAPLLEGCPCHACSGRLSRAYLRHLVSAREINGVRLLTEHNLSFIAALMRCLREAIASGCLPAVAAQLRGGANPHLVFSPTSSLSASADCSTFL